MTLKLWDVSELSQVETAPPPPATAPFDADAAKQHQQAWAVYLGLPVETTNSLGMRLVFIPPGEFDMGLTRAEIDEELSIIEGSGQWTVEMVRSSGPRQRVKIAKPFYLQKYETTVGEYRKFVQATSHKTRIEQYQDPQSKWHDKPHHVGLKKPNAWGLHDMPRNVDEWCADLWQRDDPREPSPEASSGPLSSDPRVVRSGSFELCYRAYFYSAARNRAEPSPGRGSLGFRVVCEIQ
jgi:formylglycine-generating enzyme required for sulfatase activity